MPHGKLKFHSRIKLYSLGYLLEEFTGAMSERYTNLVYIDLFAGPGRGRFPDGSFIEGSPLIAARTAPAFTKLILVEEDQKSFRALSKRVQIDFPERDIVTLPGNCNDQIDRVLKELPNPYKGLLTFCFVDPFDLGIHFSTIRRLAHLKIDFLVLIADQMAGARDSTLLAPGNPTINRFLEDSAWRDDWKIKAATGVKLRDYLLARFTENMQKQKFLAGTPQRVLIDGGGVKLYRLAFFSKHPLGIKFWERARQMGGPQPKLFPGS